MIARVTKSLPCGFRTRIINYRSRAIRTRVVAWKMGEFLDFLDFLEFTEFT